MAVKASYKITLVRVNDGSQGKPGIDYSQGKMIHDDPIFLSGTNGCTIYNNSANGTVTVSREEKSLDNPFPNATHELVIRNTGTANPSCGGYIQSIQSRSNAIFVRRIIAKIPTGYTLTQAQNNLGDGFITEWLTDRAGTGKFKEYIYKYTCGASGTFSSGGHVYLNGTVGSEESPVTWYVAYSTTFDITDDSDVRVGLDSVKQATDTLSSTVDTRVTEIETKLEMLSDSISMMVQDENGASLMEQTSTGWVFSMGETINKLQQAITDLQLLEDTVDINGGDITALQNVVSGFEELNNYVWVTTDGNEPCIELGNNGTFKVRITNTGIQFIDGTTIPAYVTNESLKIGKAEVEDELAFGGFAFAERKNGNMGLIWKG